MHIRAAEVSTKCFDLVKSELSRGVAVDYSASILVLHALILASKANDAEMAATWQWTQEQVKYVFGFVYSIYPHATASIHYENEVELLTAANQILLWYLILNFFIKVLSWHGVKGRYHWNNYANVVWVRILSELECGDHHVCSSIV